MKFLLAIDKFIERVSSYSLVVSVFSMLLLSVLTIVLRWFGQTIHWVDPFVRHLVFLSAFLGGVIATGRKSHIGIDIVGKYFESKNKVIVCKNIERVISLACCLTLVWMVKASWQFFQVEAEFGKVAFLGIHSKFLVAIIPIGFSLIAYRFFFIFVTSCNSRGAAS